MSAYAYIDRKFSAGSLDIIDHARRICERYAAQGLTLTLRQIYYQFVATGLLANKQTNYDRLGSILNDARLAGHLDWRYMEDRTRFLRSTPFWGTPSEIISSAARSYKRDLWQAQDTHIEVWIEKDALVGVIENVCNLNRVSFTACRGYFSQSETWAAGQRFARLVRAGKDVIVLHLGDHDPSGIDMTRDMQERLDLFVGAHTGQEYPVRVKRIALNMDQINLYAPPPNPAKLSDSRAFGYIERFGESSWELDALEPSVISTLIQTEIDAVRDPDLWDEALAEEERERDELDVVSDNYKEVIGFLRETGRLVP